MKWRLAALSSLSCCRPGGGFGLRLDGSWTALACEDEDAVGRREKGADLGCDTTHSNASQGQ